jgi:hypothetical protein
LLLHFAPKRIKTDGPGVISAIGQTLEKGRRRPPLAIKGLPPTD